MILSSVVDNFKFQIITAMKAIPTDTFNIKQIEAKSLTSIPP